MTSPRMPVSRRAFVQQGAMAAGLGLLARLPARQLWAMAPRDLLRDRFGDRFAEPDDAQLRVLALAAMEAARAAGATFADVRVTMARYSAFGVSYERASARGSGRAPRGVPSRGPFLGVAMDYGVRALVDGAWGFANGSVLTVDAVAEVARVAVEAARGTRRRRRAPLDLAPAPVVPDGRWATPIERDPLTVPFGEQRELGLAALAEAAKIPAVTEGLITFGWRCPVTVFANTEGSVITQRITHAEPSTSVGVPVRGVRASMPSEPEMEWGIVDLPTGGYGYEVMRPATLAADLRGAAERAVARARAPRRESAVAVGRYDLVLSPQAVAELLTATAAEALSLDRALGYRQSREGTSFAAPPAAMLGQYQLASPLVTLTADRSQPHGAATVGWDDEGVQPDEYTCIRDGVITDYHTSRQTAVELADWYRRRGEPLRSHGCARRIGALWPVSRIPNLTLVPGAGATTAEDLIADTKRGFYLERGGFGVPDQAVLTVQRRVPAGWVRRITNGKLGDYVRDFAIQLVTPDFWRSLDALGGAASAEAVAAVTDGGAVHTATQPFPRSTVRAVPARVRQVNVLNTGRTQ